MFQYTEIYIINPGENICGISERRANQGKEMKNSITLNNRSGNL